jgi:hypothetical protein
MRLEAAIVESARTRRAVALPASSAASKDMNI